MFVCPNCGHEYASDDEFTRCPYCGTKFLFKRTPPVSHKVSTD
jgi:DNA-directed RNA polymerase subunit RPC12/RpoP